MEVVKVISGGQTGVDRAALDAALEVEVHVGGWCPRGRRAEDGSIPDVYPLRETPSKEYAQRTAWNVRDSDGTLLITEGEPQGGTALTRKEAEHRKQPLLQVKKGDDQSIARIRAWLEHHDIRVLNVAGPRSSEAEGIYEKARAIMERLLERA